MALSDLTDREQEIVLQCLKAAADGPFIPDCEFDNVFFGVTREELRDIAARWPAVDDVANRQVARAINDSMNNLLGYPHGEEEAWDDFIGVTRGVVRGIFRKWKDRHIRDAHFS
jgi:hypothetical protein